MAGSLTSSESIAYRLITLTSFLIPLQIIAVFLRVYARHLVVGRPVLLDDIIVYVALVLQLGLCAVGLASINYGGVGHHLQYLAKTDHHKLVVWGKFLLTLEIMYSFAVTLPKLAILVLFKRLFPMKAVQYLIYALAGVLISGSIAISITALASCTPFEANFDHSIPGAKCIDRESFFLWAGVPNMVTDVIMLILPLPIVWNLHNTRRIKLGLTFTFLISSVGLATSIFRFVAFLRTDSFEDATWDAVELIIWTLTEPGIYLISACLLTYRPLLERIGRTQPAKNVKGKLRSMRRTGDGSAYTGTSDSTSRQIPLRSMNRDSTGFTQLQDEESQSKIKGIENSHGSNTASHGDAILVTTDIENTWSHPEGKYN